MIVERAAEAREIGLDDKSSISGQIRRGAKKLKLRERKDSEIVQKRQAAELKEDTVIGRRQRSRKKKILSTSEKIDITHKVIHQQYS